jgi:hypothetical protein
VHKLLSMLLVMLVALSGCGGGDDSPESADVPVTELQQSQSDAINQLAWPYTTRVARSSAEWSALWNSNKGPWLFQFDCAAACSPKQPEIDFSRHTLVAVFGELSPGQSIRRGSVTQKDGAVHVETLRKTATGGIYAAIQTPFAIVFLIPRTDLPVVFTERADL